MKLDRRTFIRRASALAAAPLVPASALEAATNARASLVFLADMEVDSYGEYSRSNPVSISTLMASGNTPVISKDRARAGTRSLRIHLNRKTSGNSYRTETSTEKNTLEWFRTHWIGFSIYVPSNWKVSNTWEVIWQLHTHPLQWESTGFSPVLGIRIEQNTDKWLIRQTYVQTPEGKHQRSDRKTAFSGLYGTVARGAWTDFVIEYCPDWRSRSDGGKGVTRIWRDGDQIIDYQGPNAVNETNTPYIKFGVYKSAWSDRNHNDPVVERLYYFDEFRVSRGDMGSYELVAPGGPARGESSRPRPPRIEVAR